MQKLHLVIVVIGVLITGLIVGCSKDNPNEPKETPPTFNAKRITTPTAMTQSTDPYAQQTVSYINMANAFAGFTSFMVPPEKALAKVTESLAGPPWTYTYTITDDFGTFTAQLIISVTANGYAWDLYISGTYNGVTVTNWLYMHGAQSNDGTSGSLTIYNPEYALLPQDEILMNFSWSTDANGVYTFTFEIPEDTKIIVTSNPDNSGTVEVYDWKNSAYVKVFTSTWTASGTGNWWSYDDNGNLDKYGTWN